LPSNGFKSPKTAKKLHLSFSPETIGRNTDRGWNIDDNRAFSLVKSANLAAGRTGLTPSTGSGVLGFDSNDYVSVGAMAGR
jgi:hypothetical protein